MASVNDPDHGDIWRGAAREVARLPRAVTVEMRRQHPPGRDGFCGGPHGVALVRWPCSTHLLADAADRARTAGPA